MNLTLQQIYDVAINHNCDPSMVMAFIHVESPSPHVGDTPNGLPLILNERHWFYKLTKEPYSKTHPHLSNKKPGGYCRGRDWIARQNCEHEKLKEKLILDADAALMSISMGLFQIMGFNHGIVGYRTVQEMWKNYLKRDDSIDLRDMFRYLENTNLLDEMQDKKYKLLARGYNGRNYWKNKYDQKLEYYDKKFIDIFNDFSPSDVKEFLVADVQKMVILPPVEHTTTYTGFPDFSQLEQYYA